MPAVSMREPSTPRSTSSFLIASARRLRQVRGSTPGPDGVGVAPTRIVALGCAFSAAATSSSVRSDSPVGCRRPELEIQRRTARTRAAWSRPTRRGTARCLPSTPARPRRAPARAASRSRRLGRGRGRSGGAATACRFGCLRPATAPRRPTPAAPAPCRRRRQRRHLRSAQPAQHRDREQRQRHQDQRDHPVAARRLELPDGRAGRHPLVVHALGGGGHDDVLARRVR